MPEKKKPKSKPSGEGGNFGPSAKGTKQTRGNRALSIAAQKREYWKKYKKKRHGAHEPRGGKPEYSSTTSGWSKQGKTAAYKTKASPRKSSRRKAGGDYPQPYGPTITHHPKKRASS